jgi:hypothetical protein
VVLVEPVEPVVLEAVSLQIKATLKHKLSSFYASLIVDFAKMMADMQANKGGDFGDEGSDDGEDAEDADEVCPSHLIVNFRCHQLKTKRFRLS